MKIKIFCDYGHGSHYLEEEVNKWLEDNYNIMSLIEKVEVIAAHDTCLYAYIWYYV